MAKLYLFDFEYPLVFALEALSKKIEEPSKGENKLELPDNTKN
jgi:hypothetical protein